MAHSEGLNLNQIRAHWSKPMGQEKIVNFDEDTAWNQITECLELLLDDVIEGDPDHTELRELLMIAIADRKLHNPYDEVNLQPVSNARSKAVPVVDGQSIIMEYTE